jgi:formylglycine-generating enzyme required for sulfatase activity
MHARLSLLSAALTVCLTCPCLHAAPTPGFVPGDAKPSGDEPAIQVPGGWMVAYDETIPGTSVTFRMIPVPGGTFRIGSPESEADRSTDEGPQAEVKVEPFWVGRHEVTWGEYKRYMAAFELFKAMRAAHIRPITPDNEADAVTAPSALYDPTTTFVNGEDDALPAVTMTQFAARQYTKWLSGLTGRFYRLPAESEWEYACRAGTTTAFNIGSDGLSARDANIDDGSAAEAAISEMYESADPYGYYKSEDEKKGSEN